jgi:hypothetical protein
LPEEARALALADLADTIEQVRFHVDRRLDDPWKLPEHRKLIQGLRALRALALEASKGGGR